MRLYIAQSERIGLFQCGIVDIMDNAYWTHKNVQFSGVFSRNRLKL